MEFNYIGFSKFKLTRQIMNRRKIILHIPVIVLFILELVSRWNGNSSLEYFVKPWLMVWIAGWFLIHSRGNMETRFIIAAFFFSWVGDMFLMVANQVEVLFYAGVGGFFMAQLFYIRTFMSGGKEKMLAGFVFRRPLRIIPFVVYLGLVLFIISDGMQGVMIPVIVLYAISLVFMSVAALNRRGLVNRLSFRLVFTGSILFVLSDSMIAINKFYAEFPRSSFLVMLTYFSAQYLIMQGLLAGEQQGDTVTGIKKRRI